MDEQNTVDQQPEENTTQTTPYVRRPWWQVAGAWIALVLFILVVAFFYFDLARGGF